jgi:hypothetical protein
VIPVYHSAPVSAILENAAYAVDEICEQQGGSKSIVGLYYLGDWLSQSEPIYLKGMRRGIENNAGNCLVLTVNNDKINDQSGLCVQTENGAVCSTIEGTDESKAAANKALNTFLADGTENSLVDFEDFLDNTQGDFRNPQIKI